MYHVYNVDTLQVAKITPNKIKAYLTNLINKGAVFSTDLDNEITYSFDDDFETLTVKELLKNAPIH